MKHLVYTCTTALIFVSLFQKANAQMQYTETNAYLKANAYWAWYNHIGIDWSGGVPTYDSNRISSLDTSHGLPGFYVPAIEVAPRAVSDPYTGELLFYYGRAIPTNNYSHKIVNKNHEIMSNSDSLEARTVKEQGAYIVPMPGDSTKYYVFSLGTPLGGARYPYQLYYHIVDITLNGGLGDIMANGKNLVVDSTMDDYSEIHMSASMIAIPGNNCDIWLLTHAVKPTDSIAYSGGVPYEVEEGYYYAYHITENGINNNPVISPSGVFDDVYLSVSPNRKWIMAAYPLAYFGDQYTGQFHEVLRLQPASELSKFDPNTGVVSDHQEFAFQLPNARDSVMSDYFGISQGIFSPDNSKLYTINMDFEGREIYLTQFDLSNTDSAAISQSQSILDSFGTTQVSPKGLFCSASFIPMLKSYNDTIFMSWGQMNKMSSINKPNEVAGAIEFQLDYFSLPIDKLNAGGRDFNEVVYPMYHENTLVLDTQTCQPQVLAPRVLAPYANYKWSNGETDSTITVTSGDLYWVTYSFLSNNCVHIYTDTFKLNWEGINPPPVITIEVDTLSTTMPYASYQWLYEGNLLPGETDRQLTVALNGDYRVIVTNAEGCSDTSEVYTVTNKTRINDPHGKASVKLFPNPTRDRVHIQYKGEVYYRILDISGRALSELKQGHEVDLSVYAPGVYQLILVDKNHRKLGAWKVTKL